MIKRQIEKIFLESLSYYPIVVLTGPRQSGKSTFLQNTIPSWKYVSLETPDIRLFCKTDPKGFLETYSNHTIFDEIQRVPEFFSYLQTKIDETGDSGQFILSGSQNFLLMKSISQSLAGRCAILKMMPFSTDELKSAQILPKSINEQIFKGGYPRIYDKNIPPTRYYSDYLETYVQRDVRELENIGDLSLFTKFIKLCAGRVGQILNISSLANDCGISATTATRWLSVLETSFIIHKLTPDYRNFTKRLVKSPKIYFYDVGFACFLLGIKETSQIENHYLRGGLFENLVINRMMFNSFNNGQNSDFTFWRDKLGLEIDLLQTKIDESGKEIINAFEIKSGQTFDLDYFSNLQKWATLPNNTNYIKNVIYAGEQSMQTKFGQLLSWNDL